MHPNFVPLLLLIQAEDGGDMPPPSGSSTFFVPLLLVFAIFWFVLILPERKQRKKRQAMMEALAKGDRVLTTGGIYGTVVQAQDEVITLQVADGVRMRFARPAIQNVLADEAAEQKGPAKEKEEAKS